MKVRVTVLNSNFLMARAETPNDLAVSFRVPNGESLEVSDELDLDLERLDTEQEARNLRTGKAVRLKIDSVNVRDLRRPDARFRVPPVLRRRGG